MGKISVEQSAFSSAAPADVFALLVDGASWPDWAPVKSFELVAESPAGGGGVGAVRAFNSGLARSIEEVTTAHPPEVFGYRLTSSKVLHVRDYEALVRLTPEEGTLITWSGSFRPLFPLSGWIWKRIISNLYVQFASGLAECARGAQQHASGESE